MKQNNFVCPKRGVKRAGGSEPRTNSAAQGAMIQLSAARRAGTPDEVAAVGALLMGPEGTFITGSDILMDGGVTAAYWYGDLAPGTNQA